MLSANELAEIFACVLLTHVTTRNKILGFAVSHLNSDLNAVNYSQKLKKFINSIQVKFSRPLNDDGTEDFNQI